MHMQAHANKRGRGGLKHRYAHMNTQIMQKVYKIISYSYLLYTMDNESEYETGKEINRQTDNRQIDWLPDIQTWTHRQTYRYTDTQTNREQGRDRCEDMHKKIRERGIWERGRKRERSGGGGGKGGEVRRGCVLKDRSVTTQHRSNSCIWPGLRCHRNG